MRFQPVLIMACGLLAGSASAQPAAKAPMNAYPPAVYRMNGVSKSMNLTPEQMAGLTKLTAQTQGKSSKDYGRFNSLTDAQRQALNQKYSSAWNKGAAGIFTPEQRARYQQLTHQYGGFNALSSPDVQKRLNLTPAQLKNLRDHSAWSNQQWQQINRLRATDPAKAAQLYNNYRKQNAQRFNTFLTPAQQKAWRGMTGTPFQFQPNFTPAR